MDRPDPAQERITDLEAVAAWFLSGYENKTYVDHYTLERFNPLAEVISEIRDATGVDLEPDIERLSIVADAMDKAEEAS